jgi:peptidoglycan/xylan/chitin deacetylase (PgdA/CDA1 family)
MSSIPILCYHNVGSAPARSQYKLLYVTPERLARQLWIMRRLGLRAVSLGEALPQLRSSTRSNLVILTFDDGYVDTVAEALPILQQYRCTATCYLISDLIGMHNRWDCELLQEKKALMTRRQADQWLAAGMEIGSHSCSHPRLHTLHAEAAQSEIASSRAALRALFGIAIDHFAYPFGGITDATVAQVKRAGYTTAVGLATGVVGRGKDLYRLPRILVNGEHGLARLLLRVTRSYADLRLWRRSA